VARAYRFRTTWHLDAPPDRVAAAVRDFGRWPAWWPGLVAVEPLGGGRMRQRWRSPLGYPVTLVAVVERASDEEVEGSVEGTVAGRGRCTIAAARDAGGTRVEFAFDVEARTAWMRAVAPLARPVLAWAHRALMRRGGAGIARELGANLACCSSSRISA
jgi:carbon monoxide dehydrogenase subunit G